ncbi:unnamed protein product [Gordionus sp. m RMFG-2023]
MSGNTNSISMKELCCLFCCPPLPSRIAAKLAFLPPEPTYTLTSNLDKKLCNDNNEIKQYDKDSENIGIQDQTQVTILLDATLMDQNITQNKINTDAAITSASPLVAHFNLPNPQTNRVQKLTELIANRWGNLSRPLLNLTTNSLGKRSKENVLPNNTTINSAMMKELEMEKEFPSYGIHLKNRAEWQYSAQELDRLDAFTTVTSRGSVIPCLMVWCGKSLGKKVKENSTIVAPPENNALENEGYKAPNYPEIEEKWRDMLDLKMNLINSADLPIHSDLFNSTMMASPYNADRKVGKTKSRPPPDASNDRPNEWDGIRKERHITLPRNQKRHYHPCKYTILFSHGNAVDLGQMSGFFLALGSKLGADVFGYDYTGYGRYSGFCGGKVVRPSEADLYSDAEAAWRALLIRYDLTPQQVVLYGQSIGTVPTIHLAGLPPSPTSSPSDLLTSSRFAAGVVLHSPLVSGLRVAFPFLTQINQNSQHANHVGNEDNLGGQNHLIDGAPHAQDNPQDPSATIADILRPLPKWASRLDAFYTPDHARRVASRHVLIIHGTADDVIDCGHGRALHSLLPRPALPPLWVPGAGHNDIESRPEYLNRLKKFFSEELG